MAKTKKKNKCFLDLNLASLPQHLHKKNIKKKINIYTTVQLLLGWLMAMCKTVTTLVNGNLGQISRLQMALSFVLYLSFKIHLHDIFCLCFSNEDYLSDGLISTLVESCLHPWLTAKPVGCTLSTLYSTCI
jgi:hypothetical protein